MSRFVFVFICAFSLRWLIVHSHLRLHFFSISVEGRKKTAIPHQMVDNNEYECEFKCDRSHKTLRKLKSQSFYNSAEKKWDHGGELWQKTIDIVHTTSGKRVYVSRKRKMIRVWKRRTKSICTTTVRIDVLSMTTYSVNDECKLVGFFTKYPCLSVNGMQTSSICFYSFSLEIIFQLNAVFLVSALSLSLYRLVIYVLIFELNVNKIFCSGIFIQRSTFEITTWREAYWRQPNMISIPRKFYQCSDLVKCYSPKTM